MPKKFKGASHLTADIPAIEQVAPFACGKKISICEIVAKRAVRSVSSSHTHRNERRKVAY